MSEEVMNSDSFFGKNGTIQKTMNVANNIQALDGLKSKDSKGRLGALGAIVQFIMSLF